MSLVALAQREAQIGAELAEIRGSFEQRDAVIATRGLDIAYRDVLDDYLAIADARAYGLEATKRAVFLAWYANAEPTALTGLDAVTRAQLDAAVRQVDGILVEERGDPELLALLAHCYAVVDFPFTGLSSTSLALLRMAISKSDDFRRRIQIPADPWERGQLGFYFASMGA